MRMTHQAVVLDMPRHMVATQKRVLAAAHGNRFGDRDVLGWHSRQLAHPYNAQGPRHPQHITQVSSPIGPNHPAAVDETAFAKGAQAKIDFIIPDDHKNVTAASNAGKMRTSRRVVRL